MAKRKKNPKRKKLKKLKPSLAAEAEVDKLRASIRRNVAEGMTREQIEEMIQEGVIKGGNHFDDTFPKGTFPAVEGPEALGRVADNIRTMVDEEFRRAQKGVPHRDWLVTDNQPFERRATKPQDRSVENYMRAMASMFAATRVEQGRRKRDAIILWQCLRDARVFHFKPEVYAALHHEVDVWTTEELAGLTWRNAAKSTGKRPPKEEGELLRATILKACARAPYPDKFPFPSMFIGYGAGLQLSLAQLAMRAPGDLQDRLVSGSLIGHVMTEDGFACAIIEAVARSDEGPVMDVVWFDTLRSGGGGGWVRSEFHLEPWVLPNFVAIINDHRKFVLENPMAPHMRRQFKQDRKKMGLPHNRRHTPPPYYTLRMKTQLIREKVRKGMAGPPSPRSYKTDVRGHERCRIARGPFPLDPELGAKFRKRGYKLFTTNHPDADTLARLHERGQPYKRADEWLAILTTWVETHLTNNDPDLPYIPAVRIAGNVRTSPKRQPTSSWADDPGR